MSKGTGSLAVVEGVLDAGSWDQADELAARLVKATRAARAAKLALDAAARVLAEAEALEEMLRVRTSEAMDLSECTRLDVPGGRVVAVADRTRTVKGMMHVVGSRGLRVQLIEEA